jgi:hypothetical protein
MFYLHSLVKINVQYLKAFSDILKRMDENFYGLKNSKHTFSGTIGAHSRHIIEFYQQFLKNYQSKEINYDARERALNLETDKDLAEIQLLKLIDELEIIALNEDEIVATIINEQKIISSIGRELSYLAEHTVHHFALIRFIAESNGMLFNEIPEFGIAQSTSLYRLAQGN